MGDYVIAIIFDEDKFADSKALGEVIDRAQKIARDIPDVNIQLTRGDAAATIRFFAENKELPLDEEESNLVSHAREELERLGNDADFNASIIGAVKAFSTYGHSGGSASVAIPLLNDLLNFRNIAPLTDDPKEWNNVSDMSGEELWQSRRCSDAFSHDGGKTYYLLSEGATGQNPHPIHESEKVTS